MLKQRRETRCDSYLSSERKQRYIFKETSTAAGKLKISLLKITRRRGNHIIASERCKIIIFECNTFQHWIKEDMENEK